VRRDGDHSQQPRPFRPRSPVHILRKSLLPEVRAQDSHQVTTGTRANATAKGVTAVSDVANYEQYRTEQIR
jgi:hypothetical protein